MKKLAFLIPTEGKTAEQISSEAKLAWEKYCNEMKNQTKVVANTQKVENSPENEK